ncbi:MAG: C10 family peptidase, partial [Bacteroidales bacterium]|nr:C10 family peptidase [Bacteroidales bacterium]
MKNLFLLLIVSLISISLFAGFVPKKEAEKVAKNHYYQSIGSIKSVDWDNLKTSCVFDPSVDDIYNFYVFNVNGDEGYVIVSSDDQIKPILAYSFEGGFNYNNMAPSQAEFLKYFDDCIAYASENSMPLNEKIAEEWESLLNYTPGANFKQKVTSPNLLKNINWNQTWPYNAQCPEDPDGINGHVPVGCVATAMLQVMKYYNWPPSGEGSKTHNSWFNGGYGNITINFAQQTYDWFSMPNQASTQVNTELGKINFHAGVGVSMYWGPDGSGSQTDKIVTALETYFKYSTACQYVSKSSYTESSWMNLIKAQIDDGKPVVYSGSSTTTGHAWNCDGYQDETFHMNWGWGGAGNGYYTLDNLTSTATPGGPENNFNVGQDMVINIYPREDFPAYCTGTKTITGTEGAFDDGSSAGDYEANSSCVYVLKPECGAVVNITFNDFELGDGDVVQIYDGDETSDVLLVTYDADNTPGDDITSGTNGALTVRFNTNATSQADGWNLNYSVKNCKTNMSYTDPVGSFDDGSGTCEYSNSTVCSWIIEPEGASYITITFDEFDIAGNAEFVKIYKDQQLTANVIASFTPTSEPIGPINVPSGVAIVQFFADANTVADGWSLHYTSSTSDVSSNIVMSNMGVMPNPGNSESRLVFTLTQNSETKIYLTNILGEIIASQEYSLIEGVHEFSVGEMFKS